MTNWMFAAAVSILSFIAIQATLTLARTRLTRIANGGGQAPTAELIRSVLGRTSKLMILAMATLLGLSVLQLPPPWDSRVQHLWFLALAAQCALYADGALALGARRYFRRHTTEPEAPATVAHTLIVWALQTALWIMFALAMLDNLGINVTTFVASLGIGGIAVALAAQNILGDLFASLAIAVDKPFEVGDAISVASFSGSVEKVGLKTTRVRADSGEQIVIGNAELLKQTVRNFKRMSNRRVQFALRINPDIAPALAAQVPLALQRIIEQQAAVRFDRAHLKTLDQNWLEFDIVYFIDDASYTLYMDSQQAILLATMQALADLGVSMAPAAPAPAPAPAPAAPLRPAPRP